MRYKTVVLAVATLGVLFTAERSTNAQKQYMDAFAAKYPKVAQQVGVQKCGICHGGKKVQRSIYAKALEKALGAKKVKNRKDIDAALDTVAAQVSEKPLKTYGDLLNAGTLPKPFP